MVSATGNSIAAYDYFRMFDSFKQAYGGTLSLQDAFLKYNFGYR
ncbi:MAG: hypothetical protein ACKOWK_02875 [Micrococcales bacterium]